MDVSPADDREEVAIEMQRQRSSDAEQFGWRVALGTALIVGSYGAWSLIPFVIATDLPPSIKAALSGLFGATPFLSKVAAIALMGRPAYNLLKRTVFARLRRNKVGLPSE